MLREARGGARRGADPGVRRGCRRRAGVPKSVRQRAGGARRLQASLGDAPDLSDQIGLHRARRGASRCCGVPCAPPSRLLAGKAEAVGALRSAPLPLTALPSGCHEAAVRAGTSRDKEGGDGLTFSKNLKLVRGKVASRKELSHQR